MTQSSAQRRTDMFKGIFRLLICIGSWAILGMQLGVSPAWSQTACGPEFVGNPNFCQTLPVEASVPPSPPATTLAKDKNKNPFPAPGYPLKFAFIFLCSDFFDGHLLDCGYSVEIVKPVDSTPSVPSAENGGHIAREHGSAHPLIEPKDSGKLIFAGLPGSSVTEVSPPNPLKMKGQTGGTVAVVLYPVPQASGDLLVEIFDISPPRYLCGPPGCFDQVPGRFGLNRMKFLTTIRV